LGRDAQQLTWSGGSAPEESPDGKWLYYSGEVSDAHPLERVPSAGGESAVALPSVAGRNYALVDSGIWYFTPNTKEGSLLQFYEFATRSTRTAYRTSLPVFAGMTMSPDRRRILFTQTDRSPGRDLMLLEQFR
jgi:hypothetical protein